MRSLEKKVALMVGCLAVLAVALLAPPSTQGDEWNRMTRFSVNHPFEVPGMVLQPNTRYVIQLYDSPAERHVVQIYNEDRTRLLTQFFGISSERLDPVNDTLFTFTEMQPGYPLPMKEWFYPGRTIGLEFVYPKKQATEIARHAKGSVLSEEQVPQTASITKSETTTITEEKPSVVEESTPAEPVVDQEQQAEQENVDNAVQIAQNTEVDILREKPSETPAIREEAPAPSEPERQLPRTAGELPLIALIGVLCVGAGLGLKVISAKY
jgi:hypothetical protein